MNNSERAAYLKGLIDGLELDLTTKEGKVISAMVDLIDDLCLSIEELEDGFDLLSGQVDEIDEDLGSLEEDFYEDAGCSCGCEDDDEEDYHGHHHHGHSHACGCDCDGDCDGDCECGEHFDFDDEDECQFEVTCPSCGDTIELTSEMLDEGSIDCPGCGVKLEFDFDEIEEVEEDGDIQ